LRQNGFLVIHARKDNTSGKDKTRTNDPLAAMHSNCRQ